MAERLAAVRAAVTGGRGAAAAVGVLSALAVAVALVIGPAASDGRSAAPGAGPAAGPESMPGKAATTVEAATEDLRRLAELPGVSNSTRLHVPSIGLDAPVVPVPLRDGGALDPPEDVTAVGWWTAAPTPATTPGRR